MKRALGLVVIVVAVVCGASDARSAELNRLTAEEIADGWILLFDGETTFGWQASSSADWKVEDGRISVSYGEKGLLCTTSEFADYVLRLEFKAPASTNSGIFLRTPLRPADPAGDCYELNIAGPDVSPFSTGSFVNRKKSEAAVTGDDWHAYEVTADGAFFRIRLDGVIVLEYTDPAPVRRGFIGLQLNSGPVEFRNVKLKPLGLTEMMNGKDLSGWKVHPDKASQFTVAADGAISVKNGNGQLESEGAYADFVLQLEAQTLGKGLNSGIFFRNIPGSFWQGYESQIQNAFKENDRTQPVDCGTGGFYRRQNARKVVADDFTWFHKTLVVSGPHMAAWVNGYQVSDWTDTRAPNENPRQGLRTEAGSICIQGHDPTTDLLFRNFRIVEMPAR